MVKYCPVCDEEYEYHVRKCLTCGGKLEKWYTQDEVDQMDDDDAAAAAINMIFFG